MKIQDPDWGDRAAVEQWSRQQIGTVLNGLPPITNLHEASLVMEMLDKIGEPKPGTPEWDGFKGLRGWMRAMQNAMNGTQRDLGGFLAFLTLTLRENNYLRNEKAIKSGKYPAEIATNMIWTMTGSIKDCVSKVNGRAVPMATLFDGIINCLDAAMEEGLSKVPHTPPTEATVCGGCAITELQRRTSTCCKGFVAYAALLACGEEVSHLSASDVVAQAYITDSKVNAEIADKIEALARALLAVPLEGSRDLRPLVDAG